jgi:hypothetical protein
LLLFATGVGAMGLPGWRHCTLVAKVSLALAQPSLLIWYGQRLRRSCCFYQLIEGIDPSDDPFIGVRDRAYAVSFSRRNT